MVIDSRVTARAVSEGRSSGHRVDYWLRRIAGVCLSYSLFFRMLASRSWARFPQRPARRRRSKTTRGVARMTVDVVSTLK